MSPLFVPGPVDVAPEVLAAQARPMLPHRSREFEEIFHRVEEKASQVFETSNRVFIGTHSGTGMQEAAVRNFVQEGVLCLVNGAYSERWAEVAQCNGKETTRLDVEWGKTHTPEQVAEALRQIPYEALAIVHNETSTGAENPLPELIAAARQASPETLILVDAVSSLGGVKIEMEAWGIDFLYTCSQKCLALPPGLALAAASERAMRKAESVANRGWYFDLLRMDRHRQKDSTPMTPAMSLIYALDVGLARILAEGLENRFARHAAMARLVQSWAAERGMPPRAAEPHRSKTVSALENSKGWDISALNRFLLQRGMRLANGYGIWKDKTYRIATMGETQLADVEMLDEYMA
jgi:aspartate aminotransferase-like enzyme